MSESQQPAIGSGSQALAVRRMISAMLGLEAACCLVLALWPGLAPHLAKLFGIELPLDSGLVRLLAIAGFVGAIVGRIALRAGRAPSRAARAWTELAAQSGGVFTDEAKRPAASGWEGGPTVRWGMDCVPVTLTSCRENRNAWSTRYRCRVRLARPFQFMLTPKTAITKALGSPRTWGFVLEMSKRATVEGEDPAQRQQAVERLAFLARPEVSIGDSIFDGAFLLKSSEESHARDFFSDSGVGHWLRELNGKSKSWSLSLMAADSNDGYLLSLESPGFDREPESLRVGRSLVEAAIGRLRDRGLLAPSQSNAA